MSCARGTTVTFFIMFLISLLMSEVYLLVKHFEKPDHNAVRHFSCFFCCFFFQPKIVTFLIS